LIGVAVNVAELPAQIVVALAPIVTEGVSSPFTVIVIWLLVTEAGDGHVALDVMITVTLSVFTSVELVNVGLLVPVGTPFTCHWYVGVVPGFVGVAVNITEVPAQILFPGLAAIITEGVVVGLTVMLKEQLLLQLLPSVYVYVIACVPTPAFAGLKFPPLTPVPL
jgi:hypothetical protein